MFRDRRSKKVVFVSHCILNANSISDSTADYAGVNVPILTALADSGVGISQMPCPELMCLGLDRGDVRGGERLVVIENTRIRRELEREDISGKIETYVEQTVHQIEEYLRHGFSVLGIIGVDRSPSCGVATTSDENREIPGRGLFMQRLSEELESRNLAISLIGTKGSRVQNALVDIQMMLTSQPGQS